jgi:hypothetical protein
MDPDMRKQPGASTARLVGAACALAAVAGACTLSERSVTATTPVTSILVGTDKGVHRLSAGPDPSRPWRVESTSLSTDGRSVRAFALDPDGVTVLAGFGMRGAGLEISRDRGLTWTPVPGWPAERQAWSIALHQDGRRWVGSQPADLWEGSRDDLAWIENPSIRAIPERKSWDFIAPPFEAHLLDLRRDSARADRWLGVIEQGGIIGTDDGGKTWRQVSPIWDAHRAVFARDGSAIAATGTALFRRATGAAEWMEAVRPRGYVTGLTVDRDGTIFAALKECPDGVLWSSRDHGASWSVLDTRPPVPEPGHGVHALIADAERAGVLYHGADDEVWRVEDGRAVRIADGLPVVRRLLGVGPATAKLPFALGIRPAAFPLPGEVSAGSAGLGAIWRR